MEDKPWTVYLFVLLLLLFSYLFFLGFPTLPKNVFTLFVFFLILTVPAESICSIIFTAVNCVSNSGT